MLSIPTILKATSRGAEHHAQAKPNQDSVRTFSFPENETIIIAIADGHGSSKHYLSHFGSDIATRISLKIFRDELSKRTLQSIVADIGVIIESIVTDWEKTVNRHYIESGKHATPSYELGATTRVEEYYGTTLSVLVVNRLSALLLSIGDCDCFYQKLDRPFEVVDALGAFNRGPGEETDSLCSRDAVNRFVIKMLDLSGISGLLLATDGMYKSLERDEDVARIMDYYSSRLQLNLEPQIIQDDLEEQTLLFAESGSGDDCTMVFVDLGQRRSHMNEAPISYPIEWSKKRRRNAHVSLPVINMIALSLSKSLQSFATLAILSILTVPLLEIAAQEMRRIDVGSLHLLIKSMSCRAFSGSTSPLDFAPMGICPRIPNKILFMGSRP